MKTKIVATITCELELTIDSENYPAGLGLKTLKDQMQWEYEEGELLDMIANEGTIVNFTWKEIPNKEEKK